jgi:hypothetical protein
MVITLLHKKRTKRELVSRIIFIYKVYQLFSEHFAYINELYFAELQSPVLPWKPFYSQVGLCLQFTYLMPSMETTTLKFFLNITGSESQLLWSLTGFHGNKWQLARVPCEAQENSKVGTQTVCSLFPIFD